MILTNASSAREFGKKLAKSILSDTPDKTWHCLAPVLGEHTPFRLLDLVGEAIAFCPELQLSPFLDEIATNKTIGGWTVIASALREHLSTNPAEILEHARAFIIRADTWYACDCFGERVIGKALVDHFEDTLQALSAWRTHPNKWVRRVLGVAGHLWAKRSKGASGFRRSAEAILTFYAPMLSEKQIDAAKGIGWALKTLGRYYPVSVYIFLSDPHNKPATAVIHRKALKFLPEEMKTRLARGRL